MPIRRTEETDLCRIAARHDTDKGPGYTPVYYDLLAQVRNEPLRLLEIGVYNGGSLQMWREFLPNATLFAIDVDRRCLEFAREIPNTYIRLVDQANVRELQDFIVESGGEFDFVVDDGGHMMVQQITAFEVLFPHVVSGGVYVIEDVSTAYWQEYGGRDVGQEGTSVALVKRLIDSANIKDITQPGHGNHSMVSSESLAQLRTDVASVSVYPGHAVIVKDGLSTTTMPQAAQSRARDLSIVDQPTACVDRETELRRELDVTRSALAEREASLRAIYRTRGWRVVTQWWNLKRRLKGHW